MKPHILGRFWIGFGIGTVIGTVVTILVSYAEGSGAYFPVMPALQSLFSTEINAVAVQFLLFGLIGVVFAEAGIIFMVERWGFLQKCLLHFAVTCVFFLPFLWLCYFRQEAGWKLLIIFANLLFTYAVSWIISYCSMQAEIREINRKIERLRGEKRL